MRHMQFTIIGVGKKEVKKGGARVSRDENELLPAMTTLLPQKCRSDNIRLEEPNFNMTTYGQRAFSVAAPELWNKLPFEIRACYDVNLFKSKLKTFLFKKVYDI